MAEQEFFKKALSDFVFDTASGDAIRHLAAQGCTVKQISERLDYPTPIARIKKTVWEELLARGILRTSEPGSGEGQERYTYKEEKDSFGRSSFRRVKCEGQQEEKILWRELHYDKKIHGPLARFLAGQCAENGADNSYMQCGFGDGEALQKAVLVLEPDDRDYLLGLPWTSAVVYHRLDERMRRIAAVLYAHGEYRGRCYFAGTGLCILLD